MEQLVGRITDLPTMDVSAFIPGAEKRIVFGLRHYWDTHVMRNFRLPPGTVAPLNHHPWVHWALCIGGKGKFKIGEVEYDIESGYWMHVPGNIEHTFWNTEKDSTLDIICIVVKEGDVNPLDEQPETFC